MSLWSEYNHLFVVIVVDAACLCVSLYVYNLRVLYDRLSACFQDD